MAGLNSVVVLLKRDHQKVGQMLSEFDALELDALGGYFRRLEEQLVRHEIAEELVVYPAFRKEVPRSDSIADACLAEQTEAETALAKLEREDTATESFRNQLEELREAVLAHATHEEREVFPSLETYDAADLQSLGERYERALAAASPVDGAGEDVRGGSTSDLADRIRAAMSHAD
jgi:hemerythrin superfamily protein